MTTLIKKICISACVGLMTLTSIATLVDLSQRYAGNLRIKSATLAHEELEPAQLVDSQGKPNNIVHGGDEVFVHEHYRKLQSCHSYVNNHFINRSTNILYRGEVYLNWFRADDYNFTESVELPKNLQPGEYTFRRKTISFCAGDQTFYTLNFELPLTIVK